MIPRLLLPAVLLVWTPARAATPPSPPPTATASRASADRSLTLERYVELGVPSPERDWNGADYAQALKALTELARERPAELPRYQSARSGPLFSRMTAFENVDSLQTSQVGHLPQIQLLSALMEPAANLLALYLNAHAKDGSLAPEMLELQSFVIHASARMVGTLARISPSDVGDPKAFESGLAQVRVGMGKVLDGALATLAERGVYSEQGRLRFLGKFKKDLPLLLPWLQPLTRREVPVRVESLIAQERSPELTRELTALRPIVAVSTP